MPEAAIDTCMPSIGCKQTLACLVSSMTQGRTCRWVEPPTEENEEQHEQQQLEEAGARS